MYSGGLWAKLQSTSLNLVWKPKLETVGSRVLGRRRAEVTSVVPVPAFDFGLDCLQRLRLTL